MKNLRRKPYANFLRGLIEAGFIIFLFYSNLLMGEYNRSGNGRHKDLTWVLHDIFTKENFLIAVIASLVGYLVFEFLRKKI
jgi:hypothetical protein